MIREDVVEHVAEVLARSLDGDESARAEWATRLEWATLEELDVGMSRTLDPIRELLAEHRRARQADIDSGLADWAFLVSHRIRADL